MTGPLSILNTQYSIPNPYLLAYFSSACLK
jgi:hypothetical protein